MLASITLAPVESVTMMRTPPLLSGSIAGVAGTVNEPGDLELVVARRRRQLRELDLRLVATTDREVAASGLGVAEPVAVGVGLQRIRTSRGTRRRDAHAVAVAVGRPVSAGHETALPLHLGDVAHARRRAAGETGGGRS